MAASNMIRAIVETRDVFERWIYTDSADDPGGPTKGGITLPTLSRFAGRAATAAELEAMTRDTAAAIYAALFWQAVSADEIAAGLDFMVFDMDVLSGANSARCLQRLAGFSGADVDGWIGPETLAAIARLPTKRVLPAMISPSIRILQEALGITADGVWGPETDAAAAPHQVAVLCAALHGYQHAWSAAANPAVYRVGWEGRADARLRFALALPGVIA